MKSRWFLIPAAILLGLALFSSLSVPVAADTPSIKLVLGGTGATPWAINAVAPGDSGTKAVTLSNTGFSDGVVTIWISDIVNNEGVNLQSETGNIAEPGELGDYLMLNVSVTNLTTDFILPAKLSNFPQADTDTKYIIINPLKAFSTLNLQWEWRLPLETGDDVQGDTLSFTINYMLEEFPTPASPPPPPQGSGGGPQSITNVGLTMTGPSGAFTGLINSYTLTVTNTGMVVLNDVVVTDYFPAFLIYESSIPAGAVTGNQITWNLGTMKVGESKEINLILASMKSGTAINTATVTTREGVTSTDIITVKVLGTLEAYMSLIDSNDSVNVNDEFTYTIKVSNQSESIPLHNMTIIGLLPDGTVYVSADGPTAFTITGQEVRFGAVTEMQPGATVEFHFKVKATTAGASVFKAIMSGDELGEPVVSQESTMILGGTIAGFTPSLLLPSIPVLPQVPPANKDTITIETLPPVIPASSGVQGVKSVWWILILAISGEVILAYFVIFLMKRKRKYQTTRHQKRVAELASAIAWEMDLSKKLVKMLLMFGIIHGTGTKEIANPAAQTALQYHETLNGSGYPQKLAGDDILLEARILAVADAVETMSSPRLSHPGMSMDKALEEIRKYSSTLYDSEVVKACMRLINRGEFRFRTQYI